MTSHLSRRGLEQLRRAAERHAGDTRVPGLVALVGHGDEVHVEALGSLSVGGPPAARDSIFRIASTTKPLTGAATLALVEEGLVPLDEPVGDLLPELAEPRVLRRPDGPLDDTVPAGRPVTTRDLLTFTFGFGLDMKMYMSPEPWPVFVAAEQELSLATLGPPDPTVQPGPDTWIARLGSPPLIAQPGQRWLYNTGAAVLGVLAARAAGTSFAEVLRTRLLGPLGMTDTGFWTADTARLATAYQPTPDGLAVRDEPGGAYSTPPAFEDGAAGLVSTVDDLHRFARMLLDGGAGVLSAEHVGALARDQLLPEQKATTSRRPPTRRSSRRALVPPGGRRPSPSAAVGRAQWGPLPRPRGPLPLQPRIGAGLRRPPRAPGTRGRSLEEPVRTDRARSSPWELAAVALPCSTRPRCRR